ncbi:MAG: putative bifunctional diguanylate cyclase/phosphodiesterase [Acidimicrobiia bacterium]
MTFEPEPASELQQSRPSLADAMNAFEPDSVQVRRDCFDLAAKQHRRSGIIGIPSAILLVLLVEPAVTTPRLVSWLAAAVALTAASFTVESVYLRLPAQRRAAATPWVLSVAMANAAVWGLSLAWLSPPNSRREYDLVIVIFLLGASALNLTISAASRLLFVVSQIPMCVLPMASLGARGDRLGIWLACSALLFFGLVFVLHHELHQHVTSAMQMERSNRRLQDELIRQARFDDLTGLPNRLAFTELLSVAMSERSAAVLAVMLIDLDRFGVVNDSLGHDHGDRLMVDVAGRIDALVSARAGDVDVDLARVGGDEFALLLQAGNRSDIDALGDAVQGCFARTFTVGGRAIRVTASGGVALADHELDQPGDVLRHADAALQQAKRAGRGRNAVFDNQARMQLAKRIDDEAELRRALDAGEIVAWFQPVVSLATGEIIGAEALARWEHPERGTLLPGSFVPLAEECGLIDQVGRAVLHQSVRLRRALADLGITTEFTIRVNVSAHQLVSGAGAAFTSVVTDAGVDPSGICFEVTESALAENAETAVAVLAHWRSAGHKVELDDFGTGYSSLSLVRRLPLDGVKIDRAFVRDMVTDRSDRAMVEVIIDMGRRLGLSLTAEGVENEEQARALRELGCPEAQGYLWSKAVEAERLAEMLLKGAPWAGGSEPVIRASSAGVRAATMNI